MALNNTWGKNFYGRNKENDDESDTSDDQDELEQAKRLQAIKAQKMKRFMQAQQEKMVNEDSEEGAAPKVAGLVKDDSSSESDSEIEGK